ncbi:uncharacterized protein LOC105218993 [Zeugodacus cucurbitae]|uniref:uncharacterized protein LOC105218993 n=1 Tax=Zeugodacus cucurbitae TaxID=28588 RepID=UPI0005968469|nr:uncharacterized protein LOC105218993 [Zeugodacus cucurbitae]
MTSHVPTSLHGFCDASSHTYAAVIYIRTSCFDDSIRFTLLTARTKVAPLKAATISRLELSPALLLAETLQNVRDAMGLVDVPCYLWSDSAIVLYWLKKNPTTLKPFICNRVRRIQELTSPTRWHHIRSAQNPADCACRGITPEELLVHPLWWLGPKEKFIIYSINNDTLLSKDESEVIVSETRNTNKIITRLLRTIAIILRWLRRRRHLRKPVIVTQELDDALYTILSLEQEEHFSDEIRHLKSRSSLVSSSRILPLNPYLDENQILQVGGRIHKAELANDQRFSIILSKSTPLVKLLLQQAHKVTLHGGTQLMLAAHQGGLWEAAVKSAKHHLTRCVGTQVSWYSQLQTLTVKIEACLNTRPITPLYVDPEDKLALTPGDFLIRSPLLAVPEPDIQQIPSNRLKHWQWIRQLH